MQFRLYYAGTLPSSNGKGKQDVKHRIRQEFHRQLARLWRVHPLLNGEGGIRGHRLFSAARLAEVHGKYGFNFVPLVTKQLNLYCELNILMLRDGQPGGVITQRSDIDNRLNTLFDILQIPQNREELPTYVVPIAGEEDVFFCLVENDRYVTKVTVETDELLFPIDNPPDKNEVALLITVILKPYVPNMINIGIA